MTDDDRAGFLSLRGVGKSFGGEFALDVDLDVDEGESIVLLGPSGCGKTTTLRLIAGFERPERGSITIGRDVVANATTFVPPERRHLGVVFQSFALWPHMTVSRNLAYASKHGTAGRSARSAVDTAVEHALEQVELAGMGDRYPHQLSGGQQQRVALARALIYKPKALLLDEPLSSLDAALRDNMRIELKRLHREYGITMVYVTHDQSEALSLADRIIVMRNGRIEQVGSPTELFRRPRSAYVARALGPLNILAVTVLGQRSEGRWSVRIDGTDVVVDVPGQGIAIGDSAILAVRPTHLELEEPGPGAIPGRVDEVVFLGEQTQVLVAVTGGQQLRCLVATHDGLDRGAEVGVRVDHAHAVAVPLPL